MDWLDTLFGWSGRINRARYWIGSLIAILCGTLVMMVAITAASGPDTSYTAALVFGGLVFLVFAYSCLVMGAKRCHDRNMSAWWLVVFYLVPGLLDAAGEATESQSVVIGLNVVGFVLSMWGLVELGFLRGTDGPNRFGPDPLAT